MTRAVIRTLAALGLGLLIACESPSNDRAAPPAVAPAMQLIAGGDTLTMNNQSAAVVANGLVFTAGIIGMDPRTMRFAATDIDGQAHQAFVNLRNALQASGSDMQHIVKLTVHLSRPEHFQPMNRLYLEFMDGHEPARTIVGFQPWSEDFLIQLDAVARVPAD